MKIKISNKDLRNLLNISPDDFPKYASPLINLANQYAQGTRPKVVGKVSQLFKDFTGSSLSEWEKWYLERKPEGIQIATEKIIEMLSNFKEVLSKIDENLVKSWVRDLVIVKTFVGLKFQEAILRKGSELLNTSYRLATPEEESRGIDGYIGEAPVSIKPDSYKAKPSLGETIEAKIVFYRKVRGDWKLIFPN